MFEICKVDESTASNVKEFLLSVPSINEIDDEIIKNAILVKLDNEIVGVISYEKYDSKALIRYFVFKKALDDEVISKLFDKLKKEAQEDKIVKLYCVVNNEEVESLFKSLLFERINSKMIFIDEKPFSNINFENAHIMEHRILEFC